MWRWIVAVIVVIICLAILGCVIGCCLCRRQREKYTVANAFQLPVANVAKPYDFGNDDEDEEELYDEESGTTTASGCNSALNNMTINRYQTPTYGDAQESAAISSQASILEEARRRNSEASQTVATVPAVVLSVEDREKYYANRRQNSIGGRTVQTIETVEAVPEPVQVQATAFLSVEDREKCASWAATQQDSNRTLDQK